jgi:hypothetical protein
VERGPGAEEVTAEVIRVFTHDHNALEVARQEFMLARQHRRDLLNRSWDSPRYLEALEREDLARELYYSLKYPR